MLPPPALSVALPPLTALWLFQKEASNSAICIHSSTSWCGACSATYLSEQGRREKPEKLREATIWGEEEGQTRPGGLPCLADPLWGGGGCLRWVVKSSPPLALWLLAAVGPLFPLLLLFFSAGACFTSWLLIYSRSRLGGSETLGSAIISGHRSPSKMQTPCFCCQ